MDEYPGIANIDDFICCTKGNGDGLVLNMENVTETNGNRYLKCYKPRFYVSTSKSIIKALINMHSFEIQLSPIG
ncbi:hypothetical protein EWQ19_14955 [Salmonella enterica]|nr:hypothetical protein [Salmonella enterica]